MANGSETRRVRQPTSRGGAVYRRKLSVSALYAALVAGTPRAKQGIASGATVSLTGAGRLQLTPQRLASPPGRGPLPFLKPCSRRTPPTARAAVCMKRPRARLPTAPRGNGARVSLQSGDRHEPPVAGGGDSNQPSHSLTSASRVLSTVYTRVRPCFSCRTRRASSSTRKCRVVVGHLCAKRPAISPAVAEPRK